VRPQTFSTVVAIAIVAFSLTQLVPRITHPPEPIVLLNESIMLTGENYETQYSLTLSKGDQLNIKASGHGQLVNLMVTQPSSPSQALLDQEAQTFYSFEWTVPQNGSYLFILSAPDTGANAAITITKT
jgi:hypothetical protein